jgi:hypothetical protein
MEELDPQLFWRFVKKSANPDGCWIWTGRKTRKGYGVISVRINGKTRDYFAHRYSFWLANGYLTPGYVVRHKCDNPECVARHHLVEGTNQDNVNDKMERGRHVSAYGEDHGLAKLTWDEVHQIRDLYATGQYSATALAAQFEVDKTNINQIVHNKTWHDPDYTVPVVDKAMFKAKKLTRDDITAIRAAAVAGVSGQELSRAYGISPGQVSMIISNKAFTDPGYTPPEASGNARYSKITRDDARTMREAYKMGVTNAVLQQRYGLSYAAVLAIISNQRWVDPNYTPPEKKRGKSKDAA